MKIITLTGKQFSEYAKKQVEGLRGYKHERDCFIKQ